ncbi:Pseudouridine-5'-phosphatase [Tritrichomonas musculus]|uniref:Pseudouridine-5'-phosphatase n=1 Tax=Tritrichomonas musculus TaxID=1915356 RepID=A0ABR2JYC8_9EUKA
MTCWNHPIKAVIFDNDGTFLDTMNFYFEASNHTLGKKIPQDFFNSVNGMDDFTVSAKIVEKYKLDVSPHDFYMKRNEYVDKLLPNSKPFPGVVELIEKFKKKGYKVGLATSAEAEKTNLKFSKIPEVFNIFDAVTTKSDVTKAKPDPEIFFKCSEKLGNFDPSNILVFEDAANGIKAANAAGMASSFFANGDNDYQKIFDQNGGNPSYVFQSYENFDMSKFIWA